MVGRRCFKSDLPLRVWIILFVPIMSDHAAISCFTTGPGDLHSFGGQSAAHTTAVRGQACERSAVRGVTGSSGGSPVVDVVIFTSPAPVVVGEAIDLQVLLLAHGGNSSKVLVVRKPTRIKGHVDNTSQRPPGDDVTSWPLVHNSTKERGLQSIVLYIHLNLLSYCCASSPDSPDHYN